MKIKIITLIVSVFAFSGLLGLQAVYADCSDANLSTKEAVQCGVNGASNMKNPNPNKATSDLNNTIASIVNLASAFVGIAAVIMIIVGGFRYITSAGKQESIASAKNTVLYAVVGLIVVALAQVIVHFVINSASPPQCVTNDKGVSTWDSGANAGDKCTP